MIRRILLSVFASGTLLGLAGCRHCCRSCGPAPRPYLPPAPGGGFLNTPTRTIPPTSVPTSPFAPPPGSIVPADGVMPPPNLAIPRDGNFRPPPSPFVPRTGPEILFPEPPPAGAPPAFPPAGRSPEPPLSVRPAPRPEASAELPGFSQLKPGVAAGLRPTSQGFGDLKRDGFRTVVFLHAPGADTSKEQGMTEKEGLTFVAIESSPTNLSDALAKVNARVADVAQHPMYVFADDARGGAVWYLHFRTVDGATDDAAKVRANRLGLSATDTAFWIEIQKLLVTR